MKKQLKLGALLLGLAGCNAFHRKPKVVAAPPAPVPLILPVVEAPPPVEIAPIDAAPAIAPERTPRVELPTANLPPAPVTPQPRQRVEAPQPQAPAPQAAPPPALAAVLTPQQQADLRRSYRQSTQAAQQALNQVGSRRLNANQIDTVNRVRSFLTQASEAQSKDPSSAAQLAKRAELLARDLVAALK